MKNTGFTTQSLTHSLEKYRVVSTCGSVEVQAESITHAWDQIKEQQNIQTVCIWKRERWVNVHTK